MTVRCDGLKFLVAEDHEVQRRLIVRLLRTLGAAAVHEAADGRTALDLLSDPDRPVDLVISDLCMAGMDGIEFMRHLARLAPELPLIVVSALDNGLLASAAHVAKAYDVRLLGVLSKPPTAAKLAPMIGAFRSLASGPSPAAAAFGFREIAEAFTHDEFRPLFEPRVELQSGRLRSMHAVPSWQHPVRGTLAAADFMPSIQARGLGDELAWLMLQKTFEQCKDWRRAGLRVQVSITLAGESLSAGNLAHRLGQLALAQQVLPEWLVLHVHETELDPIQPRLLENLTRLRIMDFGLGVEDFGSGNMDASPLEMVPFTEIKIPRGFVVNALRDKTAAAGLAACIDVGQRRRISTIGDGMASKEEWALLHQWGCAMAQGPFVSPPLAGPAVAPWAARWAASKHL